MHIRLGPDDKPPSLDAIVIVTISRLQRENVLLNDRNEQLQAKLIHLMDEKVRLLQKLEEEELLTAQLSQETETIGEYIALYQVRICSTIDPLTATHNGHSYLHPLGFRSNVARSTRRQHCSIRRISCFPPSSDEYSRHTSV